MYCALLFAPDGDYVIDCLETKTKGEVWEKISEFGSRWFFYPVPFVATKKTIVETSEGWDRLKGKRVKTVKRFFKEASERCPDLLDDVLMGFLPPEVLF